MSLDIGQVLGGRYAVERLIGRGMLGPVYQGRDQSTNRHVAIRLIQPEFDNEQVAGFIESEVRTAGQLADAHIARLVNIGFLPTGERCVLSEYVDGETLTSRIKRLGRMSRSQVAQALTHVLEALVAAHKAGVLHRDLTPNSVILSPAADGGNERATLIDFGISRLQAVIGHKNAAQSAGVDTSSLQYLSPEQLSGLREIDARSNVYSVGAIAYEALTGRRPFEGSDFSDPTKVVIREEPKQVEELAPESGTFVAQLIRKAMARSPNARFQSADEMLAAIAQSSNTASASTQTAAAGSPLSVGGSTRPAAAQASVQASVGAPAPAGNPISAPPPVPAQAQAKELTRPASTAPQRDGLAAAPRFVAPAPAQISPATMVRAPGSEAVAVPAPASQALVPPPMPPEEEWEQRAPVQGAAVDAANAAPVAAAGAAVDAANAAPVAAAGAAVNAADAATVAASAAAPVQMVPPAMPAEERQPTSAAPASARNRVTPPPPPPPPMDPTAADIDQSVVDALFAPPPIGAHDDFAASEEHDDWAAPPSSRSEPKSAPISELQPPRLEPASRPSAAKVFDEPRASAAAPAPVSSPASSPFVSGAAPTRAAEPSSPATSVGERFADSAPTSPAQAAAQERPTAPAAFGVVETAQTQVKPTTDPERQSAPEAAVAPRTDAEPAEPQKRTILGIGGFAAYPPTAHTAVNAQEGPPPSQRPAQATSPGLQPEGPASAPGASPPSGSVPQRPTEPQPVATAPVDTAAAPPRAADDVAASQPATESREQVPAATVAVAVSGQARAGAAPVSSGSKPVAITTAATSPLPMKSAPGNQVAAAVIMDTADELGPYGKSRSRSRKPLAIALLLVCLVGGGAAWALLQNRSEEAPSKSPTESHVAEQPRKSESNPANLPSRDSREQAAGREMPSDVGKSAASTSLSQAVNGSLSQSVAAVQNKKPVTATAPTKPPIVEKPAPVAKTTASAKPPAVSKPAPKTSGGGSTPNRSVSSKGGSKDPYNYR